MSFLPSKPMRIRPVYFIPATSNQQSPRVWGERELSQIQQVFSLRIVWFREYRWHSNPKTLVQAFIGGIEESSSPEHMNRTRREYIPLLFLIWVPWGGRAWHGTRCFLVIPMCAQWFSLRWCKACLQLQKSKTWYGEEEWSRIFPLPPALPATLLK